MKKLPAKVKRVIDKIRELGGEMSEVGERANTNNDWGFGGWYGVQYRGKIRDIEFHLRNGKACFRHLPEESLFNVRLIGRPDPRLDLEMFLSAVESGVTREELLDRWYAELTGRETKSNG